MNIDDLAVQIWDELRKDRHRHDTRQFIRGLLEQKSDAELALLLGSSNEEPVKAGSASASREEG